MNNDAYELCDKILHFLFSHNNILRTDIEYQFKKQNIFPCLEELTNEKLITHNSNKSHYSILPFGAKIFEFYGTYSAYKNRKVMFTDIKEFKENLLNYLIHNYGKTVNIREFMKDYCGEVPEQQAEETRERMRNILRDLDKVEYIEIKDEAHNKLLGITYNMEILRYEFTTYDVYIRITDYGKTEYEKSKKPPPSALSIGTIYGSVGAIGHNSTGLVSNQTESPETKEWTKEQLKDAPKNRWYRIAGFIVLALGTAAGIALLIIELIKKN